MGSLLLDIAFACHLMCGNVKKKHISELEHLLEKFSYGVYLKGTLHPKIKLYLFFLLPVDLFILLDCLDVSWHVLETSAVEMSLLSISRCTLSSAG